MRNKLKKHIRVIAHKTGRYKDVNTVFFSLYLRNRGTPYLHISSRYYYSAIRYDPLNPDWTNMVCKARIRLLDYVVEHWGDKPWEAL